MRTLALAVAAVLVCACDDFSQFGPCDASSRCVHTMPPSMACDVNNPVFVEDFWFFDAGEVPSAVWVGDAGDVWVGTQKQSIYRSSPTGWVLERPGTFAPPTNLSGVNAFFGAGDSPQFAGGFQSLQVSRSDGGNWAAANITVNPNLFALSGVSSDDIWAAAQNNLSHEQGGQWSDYAPAFSGSWQGIWESDTRTLAAGYIVNPGTVPTILQVDAGAVEVTAACGTNGQFESIWGSSDSDIWAVGVSELSSPLVAIACHFDGATWSGHTIPGSHAYGLWGRSSTDVWATSDGNVVHWNGQSWRSIGSAVIGASGVSANLYRISGNATQVWAAGEGLVHCP